MAALDNSPRASLSGLSVPVLPRLLLPDLSAVLTVATLYYCLFVFGAGERLFRDSDSGWHIRNGEWILAHHELPSSDPYSFSKEGQPWYAWEWGSDVLMGLAHRWDGLRGVATLLVKPSAVHPGAAVGGVVEVPLALLDMVRFEVVPVLIEIAPVELMVEGVVAAVI